MRETRQREKYSALIRACPALVPIMLIIRANNLRSRVVRRALAALYCHAPRAASFQVGGQAD